METNNKYDYTEMRTELGQIIKKARKNKKLSQQDAYNSGITTKRVIQSVEIGARPTYFENILDMIYGFDVDIGEFMRLIEKYRH